MIMHTSSSHIVLIALLSLLIIGTPNTFAKTDVTTDITQQIERASSDAERSRLLVYRARNYHIAGDIDAAEQDYLAALKLESKGPTWADLAKLYTGQKDYAKAKKVIDKIDRDFAHLSEAITPMRELVVEQLRLTYLEEHPPEIIMDTEPNYAYVSRIQLQNQLAAQQAAAQQSSANIIYSQCKEKWGNNYEMVQFCIKNQTDARSVVRSHQGGIRQRCEEKWGTNYEMIEFCINNQTTAKRNLDKAYKNGEKRQHCEGKWGNNYEMIEYCMKN